MRRDSSLPFFEFFAGGGMARLGLAPEWRCAFANDLDPSKAAHYARVFGGDHLRVGDIWSLDASDLPGRAALAWASSPCQDLSLAGGRGGLAAPRSGAFWGFWRLIGALGAEDRAPPLLVIENVAGLLSSHGGADFAALCDALRQGGYRTGAVVLDAAWFTPQSRPRLFVVAAKGPIPPALLAAGPSLLIHPEPLRAAWARLSPDAQANWAWWRLPPPPVRNASLEDILDAAPNGVRWHTPVETERLLALMGPLQIARIEAAIAAGGRRVGALYRRVRTEDGVKRQRAEVRFDGLAGCLRTPAGGSSRQMLLIVENGAVRSRLLSAREAARLMGLPDEYPLPASQSAGLKLVGDGVAAPVVRWLNTHLLAPLAGLSAPLIRSA